MLYAFIYHAYIYVDIEYHICDICYMHSWYMTSHIMYMQWVWAVICVVICISTSIQHTVCETASLQHMRWVCAVICISTSIHHTVCETASHQHAMSTCSKMCSTMYSSTMHITRIHPTVWETAAYKYATRATGKFARTPPPNEILPPSLVIGRCPRAAAPVRGPMRRTYDDVTCLMMMWHVMHAGSACSWAMGSGPRFRV